MLVDLLLTCAPLAALAPAVVSFVTRRTDFAGKTTVQRRLYRSLLLAEKLPPAVPGARQIASDIERQTLHLAYLTQFPQRAQDLTAITVIGLGSAAATVAYYVALWGDSGWITVLALLGIAVAAALWLNRAVRNFGHNDALTRDLFVALGAPASLTRERTELLANAHALPLDALLRRAADIRDANHRSAMTTVSAVNAALESLHSHRLQRLDPRALTRVIADTDYPQLARSAAMKASSWAMVGYRWTVLRLLDPFFDIRVHYLNDRERRRIAKAESTGDVYKAAWLATHYRFERERMATHRGFVGGAGRAHR